MKTWNLSSRQIDGRYVGALSLWVLVSIVAVTYCWHFLPLVTDDALIAYRYSDRLLHGHGLTWNDGEHVEGYSNLLWILLVSIGGLFQPNLIAVGWILGIGANVCALGAIYFAFGRSRNGSLWPMLSGMLVVALSAGFAIWGVGGLETALAEALIAWAFATLYRPINTKWSSLYPGILLGLLAITRVDGLLFAFSIALGLFLRDGADVRSVRRIATIVAIPLAFTALQIAFRVVYYGSLVPNTAYVKIALTAERIWVGVKFYMVPGALVYSIPIVAVLALFTWRGRRVEALRRVAIFVLPGMMWLLYVMVIGGDIYFGHRHWLPALICVAFTLSALLEDVEIARGRLVGAVVLAAATLYFAVQWMDPDTRRVPQHVQLIWDGLAVGEFLQSAFGKAQPLLATDPAGAVPYASRLPSLDMLGLNDFHIAHHRPADMGKGARAMELAHELGDAAYVLSRKPDLIAFCVPAGSQTPCFRTDREVMGAAEFQRYYRLLHFSAPNSVGALWIRFEDGRLGVSRTSTSVHVPGILVASDQGARVALGSGGRPGAVLEGYQASVRDIYLPPGRWDITLQADDRGHLRMDTPGGQRLSTDGSRLRLDSSGRKTSFRILGGPGVVYGITARKIL